MNHSDNNQMRGFNIALNADESSLLDLALLGCETVRLKIESDAPEQISKAEAIVSQCATFGIGVIVTAIPGKDPRSLIDWWILRAAHWKGLPGVVAYDLMNELIGEPAPHKILMQGIIDRIRLVDKEITLIVEGHYGAIPDVWAQFDPPRGENLIYSIHMYYAHGTTHQGIGGRPAALLYPGAESKDLLAQVLAPVVASKLPILVGEFSCARWAPGRSSYNYVRDCLDLFTDNGWGWLYHAWREYQGWDAELPEGVDQSAALSNSVARTRTDTIKLLQYRCRDQVSSRTVVSA